MAMMSKKIYNRLLYKMFDKMPYDRPFVFGVGLSKTATTTLASALTILGYDVRDNPPIARVVNGDIIMDWPWWVRDCNAVTDLSSAALTPQLVQHFPNAKFIYTTRDMDRWLKSCHSHFSPELHDARIRQNNEWMNELSAAVYGNSVFQDPEPFRQAYLNHDKMIRETVPADRLLVVDFTKNPGWDNLCSFLDKPIPAQGFPHSNVGTYIRKDG